MPSPSAKPSAAPFPLDESLALFLVSPEGRDLLAASAHLPGGPPERILALRKRGVEAREAAGVVEVLDARWRARSRFPDADRLFFTADMLAQATSPAVAAYHAACLAQFATVADLGCGAGIDAIALARAGIRVTAIDQDPARLVFARANAQACGIAEDQIQFVAGDVTALDWEADSVFWDPARRLAEGGGRVSRHAERYEPPLSFLDAVQARVGGGCVKLSPALPDEVLEGLDGVVAFLSEDRTCKEACLRFGTAADPTGGDAPPWSAVLLPEGIVAEGAPTGTPPNVKATVRGVGTFVFDPDPAVIRANALGVAAEWLDAGLLTTGDSYLTGDTSPTTREARRVASAYRVIATMPYRPRAVGAWLKANGIGRLIVKKRHFDREPDAVLRELGLTGRGGGAEATLILARDGSHSKEGHLAVICEPERDESNPSNKNHADL